MNRPRRRRPDPSSHTSRTEAALRRLELLVTRRLEGFLHGDHRGFGPGPGSEPGESRLYEPGDDVRLMDWSVTARTGVPHVRMPIADRELETWLVVDLSASLDFGTAEHTKHELAVIAAGVAGYLTQGGASRIGAVLLHGDVLEVVPARRGRRHLQALLRHTAAPPFEARGSDLAAALRHVERIARRRGLVVVISDFLSPTDWGGALARLGLRHDTLAVEVVDPREMALPDVGVVPLRDPETGRTRMVDTANPAFRTRYAEAAEAQRRDIAATIRRSRAEHLQLRTDRDWLADVVSFVEMRRRRRGAARGPAR
ncbi:DUF58 domain-containing protein [Egicoccus sp. AB-alg2]|uniref:DUF58 domain-containing protein n=1 Tax=Egicoccus sp. AB-alg2 TaxID=3242693 RepID=UPI00359E2DB7